MVARELDEAYLVPVLDKACVEQTPFLATRATAARENLLWPSASKKIVENDGRNFQSKFSVVGRFLLVIVW